MSFKQRLNFLKDLEQRSLERRQKAFIAYCRASKHTSAALERLSIAWEKLQQLRKELNAEYESLVLRKPNKFKPTQAKFRKAKASHSSARREYLDAKQRRNQYAREYQELDIQYDEYRQQVEKLLRELPSSP